MENGLCLPESIPFPALSSHDVPVFAKCVTVAFHSAVNEMIWTHIIYTDGSLIIRSDGCHNYVNYHFFLLGTCGIKVNWCKWSDTVIIRSVWYNIKYRPIECVGCGQQFLNAFPSMVQI